MEKLEEKEVILVVTEISGLIESARKRVYSTVNNEMLLLHWNIGKKIVELQEGKERAKYGDYLLSGISRELNDMYGKGFSKKNLERMRQFYKTFPIASLLMTQLGWTHYLEIINIKEENKRNFYLNECINSKWSVKELSRQKKSMLYERLIHLKGDDKILELSEKGNIIRDSSDLIKDPYILEFLNIKENDTYQEKTIEESILKHLKEFILELGNGFTFVGSQVRISLENDCFYPDLVFYNRILKCFVIIDLKIGKVTHGDIGQMQMYVNYYNRVEKSNEENDTIGILLCTEKNETVVKYTLPKNNKNIYASKFKLCIPSEKDLIELIESEKNKFKNF